MKSYLFAVCLQLQWNPGNPSAAARCCWLSPAAELLLPSWVLPCRIRFFKDSTRLIRFSPHTKIKQKITRIYLKNCILLKKRNRKINDLINNWMIKMILNYNSGRQEKVRPLKKIIKREEI